MINKVTLIGNVGKDPESKVIPNGKKVTKFSLATTDGYGEKKKTSWHNIVLWSDKADMIKTGDRIYIEGRIDYSCWDKPDGTKAYKTEIIGNIWQFMNYKPLAGDNYTKNTGVPYEDASTKPDMPKSQGDDLPF